MLIDNTLRVINELNDKAVSFLYEASGELQHEVQQNTRVDTGQLKGSWRYSVDESNLESTIGSPLENAIWEEFGTGEYAVNGNGRKGGWFYVDAKGDGHFTKGKTPQHAFTNAYNTLRDPIQDIIKQLLQELDNE